ncbi:MAG: anhydro-N-acetylmuramic acid kinase [Paracoccaceae bacterium]
MEGKSVDVGAGRPVWALGLMSGTSLDGVDAALVETDGEVVTGFGPSGYTPYDKTAMQALPAVMADPLRHLGAAREEDRIRLRFAEDEVVRLHARGVVDLLSGMPEGPLPELVAFPGQTVAHYPEKQWTWQLGDGGVLARALNRPVVWDFRSEDLRQGGQGAPLAPFFHFAMARSLGLEGPVAFLNIGGVANVTWVDPSFERPEEEGALLAFDTGPGNALINDWMQARAGQPVDLDGRTAADGNRDAADLVTNFVADFWGRPGPKSLDRNEFGGVMDRVEGLSVPDGAAVLTDFTVRSVDAAARQLPAPPKRWLICGGGRQNATMMRWLAERLGAPVDPVEAVGLDGDMLEAQAFAYLAVRVLRGLPTSAPATTGCHAPVCGGKFSGPD